MGSQSEQSGRDDLPEPRSGHYGHREDRVQRVTPTHSWPSHRRSQLLGREEQSTRQCLGLLVTQGHVVDPGVRTTGTQSRVSRDQQVEQMSLWEGTVVSGVASARGQVVMAEDEEAKP